MVNKKWKFPIDEIRDNTPGCHDKLFFNSAGSSLMSQQTIDIFQDYLIQEIDRGGYDVMTESQELFDEFYHYSAKLINARSRNMAFATSATNAYSQILYAIDWKKGDKILTTKVDYVSNILSFLSLEERFGVELIFIASLKNGDLDFDDLERKMKKGARILALTHVATSNGMIQDAERAGILCKQYDCLYLLDACQSVGQLDVDVNKIQCDFLSVTGRKFLRAPRGTGFLYVSDKFIDSDFAPYCLDLNGAIWHNARTFSYSDDAKRFELWEKNYSCFLGLTQAIKEITAIGIKNISDYNGELGRYYREKLQEIPGLQLYDQGSNLCNIITWRIEGMDQEEHSRRLNTAEVIYSYSRSMSAVIDLQEKNVDWLVRFSPHYFNTKNEIDQFCERF